MNRNSNQNTNARDKRTLSDESKLSFGAAAGCFVIGAVGWLVNLARPETTLLHGLLVVAGFYCFLGVVNLYKASTNEDAAADGRHVVESNTFRPRASAAERLNSAV